MTSPLRCLRATKGDSANVAVLSDCRKATNSGYRSGNYPADDARACRLEIE
jgi:hypothetical protein